MQAVRAFLQVAAEETLRLGLSRRWVLVGLLCAISAYLAAGDVGLAVQHTALEPSAWDVHAAAVNQFVYIGYLVVVAYVALVGDTLVDDRENGMAWVILPRLGSRFRWWAAKIVSLLLAAMAVQLLFLVFCLLSGALKGGWSLSSTASAYATVATEAADAGGVGEAVPLMLLFAPLGPGSNMAWHEIVVCLYEVLAFTAVGTFLVAITVRFSKAFIPVTAALLGLVADWALGHFFDGWWRFSPGRRLLESIHYSGEGYSGLSWSSSLVYWGESCS